MGAHGVLLTCLMALGQTPDLPIHRNTRVLQLPLQFEASRRAEIKEILLFASPDQGRNWQQVATASPDKESITFSAAADGAYALAVACVNRFNKQEPDNLRALTPDQKILLIIDTMKPLVRFTTAQRVGDEVHVSWELQEESPDWASFRLEWLAKDSPSLLWNGIPASAGLTGKAAFRPGSSTALTIRLGIKDQAGNATFVTAEIAGSIIVPIGGLTVPEPGRPIIPAGPSGFREETPPLPATGFEPIIPPVKAGFPPVDKGEKPGITPFPPPPLAMGEPLKIEAFTPVAPSVSHSTPPFSPPRRSLPPVQFFNRPEVPLEYELSKVGPSGVGSVDMYWTRDEGQTWEKYADDPAVTGMTRPGKFQRLIELPGDGVYGFSLVVTSRAGRGKAPPRPGEAPQMLMEIDTLAPVAQLFPPVPDTSRPNTLLLRWQAKDKNLTANPVSLEWAERREGPWQPIALNLANSGQHPWTLTEAMPVQVYLRLKVRDAAGNESVAVTSDPQLVDLSEPEGLLLGISAPGGRP